MRPGVLVIAVLLLSGCARYVDWTKAGGSEPEFRADSDACERTSRQGEYGDSTARSLFDRCMEAKGYRKVKGGQEQGVTSTRTSAPTPQPAGLRCPGKAFWNGYGCSTR
jgi:hypothetical protein